MLDILKTTSRGLLYACLSRYLGTMLHKQNLETFICNRRKFREQKNIRIGSKILRLTKDEMLCKYSH